MKTALLGILIIVAAVFWFSIQPAVMSIENGEAAATGTTPVVPPERLLEVGAMPLKLANPPSVIRAKYLSGWSAGSNRRIDPLIAAAKRQEINAVVIDLKDYSGYVSYAMDVPEVKVAGADQELRIADINSVIQKFHAEGIYVIGRITIFQDSIYTKAHPELALKDKTTGGLWRDRKGLAWLDPAGKKNWEYAALMAEDAFAHGVDEVNFDYIRFPSDGKLQNAVYPFWDGVTPRNEILRQFFEYLRGRLAGKTISADLFGLVAVEAGDVGVGQTLHDALPYFDAVAPMVYPSHFANGSFGFANPADHPYEVIRQSMAAALAQRESLQASSSAPLATLRPWLQVFDLGAVYTPEKVKAQMDASAEVFAAHPEAYSGFMLWDPSNNYRSYDKLYPAQ